MLLTFATAAAPSDDEGSWSCAPERIVSEVYLNADGTASSASNPDAGVVTVFVNSEGVESKTASLPRGFDGLNASPELLAAFNLPPRPVDAGAASYWLSTYVTSAIGQQPARVCEAKSYNASVQSYNWSGHLDHGSGIKKASGVYVQPGFVAACAHESSHSTWSGIGGWSAGFRAHAGRHRRRRRNYANRPLVRGVATRITADRYIARD